MPLNVEQMDRLFGSVGILVDGVREDQWQAPTPCTDWTVRDLVNHLVEVNLIFAALLRDQALPEPGSELLGADPAGAYRRSAAELLAAFDQPGVLDRTFTSALGTTTGAVRLSIRIADLLAHGWDLGRATGQPVGHLPDELIEQALLFIREQLTKMPRTGRFEPAQPIAEDAPALDRLAAFLGRPPSWSAT
ncbi:TIGR03086 family metal-binding protein [Amycolatopsis nigrescens]|uniref:TIGR03086 family metal-binding protein n=1 Tax=Amycolatopsis nigrescens TaxID=381445 RepID=UPI000375E421|nr:TIGR03086 family metal-binding protein [Amycolatopsis nigrescens]